MRMRRKKNLVPRMEACGQWLIRDPKAQRGHWRELMPGAKELRLELGCGKGRFTCQTAAADPDVLFIAVERVPDAMVMAMEKARSLALTNVFFVDADAAELPEFFAPDEVDLIYINFCDPWPPKRHAKRRLTHRDFLLRYRQVLRDGGEIHFKTDNVCLFRHGVPLRRLHAHAGHPRPAQGRHLRHHDRLRGEVPQPGDEDQPVRGRQDRAAPAACRAEAARRGRRKRRTGPGGVTHAQGDLF